MNCKNCGIEINDGECLCENCKNTNSKLSAMNILSIVLAACEIILPFIAWLRVPVAEGLYSLFGMENETPTFSLFGYLFAGNQYQSDSTYWITLLIAIAAFIGIIFNIVYVVKALKKKPKCNKYGMIGAVISTIMSALFVIIVGCTAMIFKVFKLTVVPYITLVVSIVNIVIIKKLKKIS